MSVFSFSILKCGVVGILFLKHILLVPLTMAAAAEVVSCWTSQMQAPLLRGRTPEQRHEVALAFPAPFLPGGEGCGPFPAPRQPAGGQVAAGGDVCGAQQHLWKISFPLHSKFSVLAIFTQVQCPQFFSLWFNTYLMFLQDTSGMPCPGTGRRSGEKKRLWSYEVLCFLLFLQKAPDLKNAFVKWV